MIRISIALLSLALTTGCVPARSTNTHLASESGPATRATEGQANAPATTSCNPEDQQTGEATYCYDGDTCRIKLANGYWFSVRLAGIDAPEIKGRKKKKATQPFSEEAKAALNDAVKGKRVVVRQVDLDPYNRPVVELFVDGENVNLALVTKGFAEAYRGKTKRIDKAAYAAAEKSAKDAHLGIWSQKSYVSPADFRKEAN